MTPAEAPVPPRRMPLLRAGRPLKRWRYVAAFGEDAMVCAAIVWIGPARQVFWAAWDRRAGRLHGRTRLAGRSPVRLDDGRVRVHDGGVHLDLRLEEEEGHETVCPHGRHGYVWTRKQAGIRATGHIVLPGGEDRSFAGRAVIDDTAGYHARRTEWWWAAGVGEAQDGREVAFNLVRGVNDPPRGSERAIWVDGVATEAPEVEFSADLRTIASRAGELRFAPEAERRRRERLLVLASEYRQPFGTFSGVLPDGTALARALGVTEHHVAVW